jgi:hypothetical protein
MRVRFLSFRHIIQEVFKTSIRIVFYINTKWLMPRSKQNNRFDLLFQYVWSVSFLFPQFDIWIILKNLKLNSVMFTLNRKSVVFAIKTNVLWIGHVQRKRRFWVKISQLFAQMHQQTRNPVHRNFFCTGVQICSEAQFSYPHTQFQRAGTVVYYQLTCPG